MSDRDIATTIGRGHGLKAWQRAALVAAALASGASTGVRAQVAAYPVVITEPNADQRPPQSEVVAMPPPVVAKPAAPVVSPWASLVQARENQPADAPPAEILTLAHPVVIDTATIHAGDATVDLYGIEGVGGEPAAGLQALLSGSDAPLRCQAQTDTGYVCLMADGTDVAQVALANGLARTTDQAPDGYRDQEAAAQAARAGIWSDLPPAPETIRHPIVYDTATLSAGGRNFVLSGITGFLLPYTSQLQGFLASHGDSVACSAQPEPGQYVCLLPDGTDVAKVALANGLARLGDDAPPEYSAPQQEAVNSRRGYWRTVSADALPAALPLPTIQARTPIADEDDGSDGVTYAGGVPVATVGAEKVFLMLGAGALGWGYYDHLHRWHAAPAEAAAHMQQFHPAGAGLHVYDHVAAVEVTHHQERASPPRSGTAAPMVRSEQAIRTSNAVPTGRPAVQADEPVVARAAPLASPAGRASADAIHPRPQLVPVGPVAPAIRPPPAAAPTHPNMYDGRAPVGVR